LLDAKHITGLTVLTHSSEAKIALPTPKIDICNNALPLQWSTLSDTHKLMPRYPFKIVVAIGQGEIGTTDTRVTNRDSGLV
jgi:hypothetical protein